MVRWEPTMGIAVSTVLPDRTTAHLHTIVSNRAMTEVASPSESIYVYPGVPEIIMTTNSEYVIYQEAIQMIEIMVYTPYPQRLPPSCGIASSSFDLR